MTNDANRKTATGISSGIAWYYGDFIIRTFDFIAHSDVLQQVAWELTRLMSNMIPGMMKCVVSRVLVVTHFQVYVVTL